MVVEWRVKALDCQPGWRVSTRDYHGWIQWIERTVGCGLVVFHFADGGVRRYRAKDSVQVWEV